MATKRTVQELEVENLVLKSKYEELSARFSELLERTSGGKSAAAVPPVQQDKLSALTFKQHAVMLAFFAGLSYTEIAGHMKLDESTVKLHLKAVQTHMGCSTKEQLLLAMGGVVGSINSADYQRRYGIPKAWWDSKDPTVWELLTRRRAGLPPVKQEVKPKPPASNKRRFEIKPPK